MSAHLPAPLHCQDRACSDRGTTAPRRLRPRLQADFHSVVASLRQQAKALGQRTEGAHLRMEAWELEVRALLEGAGDGCPAGGGGAFMPPCLCFLNSKPSASPLPPPHHRNPHSARRSCRRCSTAPPPWACLPARRRPPGRWTGRCWRGMAWPPRRTWPSPSQTTCRRRVSHRAGGWTWL